MFRKTMIALFAVAAAGLVSPTLASARGGGHGGGGGFHGGGGGFHGGGFRGGGFRGAGLGIGLGLGLAAAVGGSFRRECWLRAGVYPCRALLGV